MLALFGSSICGFATVKLDPLCEACKLEGDKHVVGGTKGMEVHSKHLVQPGVGYDALNPAGKEVMKRCIFTVFKECLADGLGENTFCETVVSESALLGWTEAEDHEHDTVVECALTSTAPLASHSAALSRALPILTTQHSSLRPPVTPQRRGHQ